MKNKNSCGPEQLALAFTFDEEESIAEAVPVTRETAAGSPLLLTILGKVKSAIFPKEKPAAAAAAKKVKSAPAAEPADPTLDAFVGRLRVLAEGKNIAGLLELDTRKCYDHVYPRTGGYSVMKIVRSSYLICDRECNRCVAPNTYEFSFASSDEYVFTMPYIFLRQNGNTAVIPVKVKLERLTEEMHVRLGYDYYDYDRDEMFAVDTVTVGKPMAPRRFYEGVLYPQTNEEYKSILSASKPWIVKWMDEKDYSLATYTAYVEAPWLETLEKAGYAIARSFMTSSFYNRKLRENMNLLTGPGSKPKEIFKTSSTVMEVLKNCVSTETWNAFRKLDNKRNLPKDTLVEIRDRGWREKHVEMAARILNLRQAGNGRPFFTWTSLINYLGRIDMYEAIDNTQGLELIIDYLHMCNKLGMEARCDGDSLKREHDIAARLIRNRRNEEAARRMEERRLETERQIAEGNTKLARCEYAEDVYFVRAIRDYDDLLDEAKQQHNCLAGYAGRIAKGESRIFVMREVAHPDRSLVSIELSPDCRTVRQKYLAYNTPIRNKSMSDFIDRWMRQINNPAEAEKPKAEDGLVPAVA